MSKIHLISLLLPIKNETMDDDAIRKFVWKELCVIISISNAFGTLIIPQGRKHKELIA